MKDTIGSHIRLLRQKEYKTQGEIAKMLGISTPAFSKIETDITDVNLSRLKQIADLFGVEPASLLTPGQIDESSRRENEVLTEKLAASQQYCAELQAKLIAAYEMLDQLKAV